MINYDFEDYRNKQPYEPPRWLDWTPDSPIKYLLVIAFFILGIPYFFGYIPSAVGTLWQLIIIDYWLYLREQSKKIDLDQYK